MCMCVVRSHLVAESLRALRPHNSRAGGDAVRLLQSQGGAHEAQVPVQDLQVLQVPALCVLG